MTFFFLVSGYTFFEVDLMPKLTFVYCGQVGLCCNTAVVAKTKIERQMKPQNAK